MAAGYYAHLPGQLSRWGVVDVGLKCPHSCVHCYYAYLPDGTEAPKKYAGMRRASWKSTETLLQQIDLMADNNFLGFDITGGEPTANPAIVELVQRATDRGLATRMITLGQFLTGKNDLLDKLLSAGVTDFLFSYHTSDHDLFRTLTGGSLQKMLDAMARLDAAGFQYGTNAVCTEQNYRTLPDIARTIVGKNVYVSNFILMNAYYEWADGKASAVRAGYSEMAPYLREAVDILESNGVAVNVRYAPMCTIAGLEKNYVGTVGVRYDPHEWMNCVHHSGPGNGQQEAAWLPMQVGQPSPGSDLMCSQGGPILGRGTVRGLTKLFAPQCAGCAAQGVCDGIDASYLQANGTPEFVPYTGELRGSVLDRDRLSYLPGHVIKLEQDGDARRAVKRLLAPPPIPDRPLVSVVIPHFNHADEVERCLRSVAAQTWKNIEIILVDDASTDNIREVIKGIDLDNLTCLWLEQNSGRPAVPRNHGIRHSKGDLILCLDPDDWIEPSMIEEHIRQFRQSPSAGFVYAGLQTFGLAEEKWPARAFDPKIMIIHNFVPYCSVWRREMWEEVGGYDEDMALKGCEDWNFWVSAVRLGYQGVPLPRQLVHYSRSGDGLFEAEVRPNYPEKRRTVVRKNQAIYPLDLVREAFSSDTVPLPNAAAQ